MYRPHYTYSSVRYTKVTVAMHRLPQAHALLLSRIPSSDCTPHTTLRLTFVQHGHARLLGRLLEYVSSPHTQAAWKRSSLLETEAPPIRVGIVGIGNTILTLDVVGGVSAAVSKTAAAPIERVKLLIQNQVRAHAPGMW